MKKFLLILLAASMTLAASARVNKAIVKEVPMPQKSQMLSAQFKNATQLETAANFSTEKMSFNPVARKAARPQKAIKANDASLESILNGAFVEDVYESVSEDFGYDACTQVQFKSYKQDLVVDTITKETQEFLCVDIYGAFEGWSDTITAIVMEDDTVGTYLYIPVQLATDRYESTIGGDFVLYGAYASEKEGYVNLGNLYLLLDEDNCLSLPEDLVGWYIVISGGQYDGEGFTSSDNISFLKPNAMQYYYEYNKTAKKFVQDSCALYVDDYSSTVYLYGFSNLSCVSVDINETTLEASLLNHQPMYYEKYQGVEYYCRLNREVRNEDETMNVELFNSAEATSTVLLTNGYMAFADLVYDEETKQNELSPIFFWVSTDYVADKGATRIAYIAGIEVVLDNGNFKAYDAYVAGIEDLRSEMSAPAALFNLQGQRVNAAKGFVAGKNFKSFVR